MEALLVLRPKLNATQSPLECTDVLFGRVLHSDNELSQGRLPRKQMKTGHCPTFIAVVYQNVHGFLAATTI